MFADFLAKTTVAVIPANSQSEGGDIDIVFQSITTEGIGSPSLYGDDLINPLSVFIGAFESSCVGTAADRRRSCGESATTII